MRRHWGVAIIGKHVSKRECIKVCTNPHQNPNSQSPFPNSKSRAKVDSKQTLFINFYSSSTRRQQPPDRSNQHLSYHNPKYALTSPHWILHHSFFHFSPLLFLLCFYTFKCSVFCHLLCFSFSLFPSLYQIHMESFDIGVEGFSDRELGFDFLAKQSVWITSQSLLNNGAFEDGDDGFRTPTSIDRKIKMIETCPPAPKKPPPPPPSRKRKALFPLDQSGMVAEIAKLSSGKKARVLAAPATVM